MLKDNTINLKSVNELISLKFFIPSYQRGYRWIDIQVKDLLDDIYEFAQRDYKQEKDIYCLQPIVVKARNGQWELIDGQQRLTTIFIILSFLNKKRFELEFETRLTSRDFLLNLNDNIDETNVDFHHISKAYSCVKKWFEYKEEIENNNSAKEEFSLNLMKYTKVIWYEVNDGTDSRDIFTRLNNGKIPLTNSELIKALFLRSDNFNTNDPDSIRLKQLEIASEWDRIEYALQNDEFWLFINRAKNEIPTRIEFIFDLLALKVARYDDYYTFRYFNNELSISKVPIKDVWQRIKKTFLILEEWFTDRTYYHLIGFLITAGFRIENLIKAADGKTKTEFLSHIKELIKRRVNFDLLDLNYKEDYNKLFEILLLHNIATILSNQKSNYKFPFDAFKNDNWSLEHIHAQNSEGLKKSTQWASWITEHSQSLKRIDTTQYAEIISELDNTNSEDLDVDEFNILFEKVLNLFREDDNDEEIHDIRNLALLDRDSNSALNNSIFEVKRKRIIDREKSGSFIPLCTRNVFLKYYSENAVQLYYWNDNDKTQYLTDIKETLNSFFNELIF